MEHAGTNLVSLGHVMTFSGAKRQDLGLFGASERHDLPKNGSLGATRGAPKVLNWVIDAYPVNIGQLDHNVVFGSQSGAVRDPKSVLRGSSRPPF